MKLLAFSFAMIAAPISLYFLTVNTVYGGKFSVRHLNIFISFIYILLLVTFYMFELRSNPVLLHLQETQLMLESLPLLRPTLFS